MNAIVKQAAVKNVKKASDGVLRMAASALKFREDEFRIGQTTTAQLGNPGDTDWTDETHANVPVVIIDKQRCTVTFKMYYLITKVGDREYVGRASDSRGSDSVEGDVYCTNARRFGSKAQKWTGITTFLGAADSLHFTLPIYDAEMNAQKITSAQLDAALQCLRAYFDPLIAEAEAEGNMEARQLWAHDFAEKELIVRLMWQNS
jgi:hypothetical protein